jgi:hypothetical protein
MSAERVEYGVDSRDGRVGQVRAVTYSFGRRRVGASGTARWTC